MTKARAIDLYSGVGGWSLGLRLAGIDVAGSYERSATANETNRLNNNHPTHTCDIRALSLDEFRGPVDYLVGSPPCTQFSLANRGGSGDLEDGLKDVARFLEIVEFLKPKAWVMENVPRLASLIDRETLPGGALARFRHLAMKTAVYSLDQFGVPQRRKRCLIGNIDFELLSSYRHGAQSVTLRDVLNALSGPVVHDPSFADEIPLDSLIDNDAEDDLNEEEVRINRSAKTLHPIYNSMPFPDPLDRAARTITATCTRVSRESIVVEHPVGSGKFRRLSIRERACAQGFPIGFQFFGRSHAEKLKMVGNAMPPVFAYFVAHAMLGTGADKVRSLRGVSTDVNPSERPKQTIPHKPGFRFRPERSFRFAIPALRLKSGVRFELTNGQADASIDWHVRLTYGTSKDFRVSRPSAQLATELVTRLKSEWKPKAQRIFADLDRSLAEVDVAHLQAVWSHTGPGATRPFMVLDLLSEKAELLIQEFRSDQRIRPSLEDLISDHLNERGTTTISKLLENCEVIAAGLIVASRANAALSQVFHRPWSSEQRVRAGRAN
jgi:DNA (cytosine-5)-methyltransferase 1